MPIQNKEYRKIHQSAFIISLLIHLLLFFFLIYMYKKNKNSAIQKKETPILFMPQERTEKKEWATTKPTHMHQSHSSQTMQEPVYAKPVEELSTPEEEVVEQDTEKNDPQENSIDKTITSDQGVKQKTEEPTNLEHTVKPPTKKKSKKKNTQNRSSVPKVTPAAPAQNQPTFADLVKGFSTFIEQTKHGVESRIHMLGKDGKKPTDEQLKYERYLEKIIMCLEKSLHMNRPYNTPPTIKQNPRVSMALNRQGILVQFKIIESSGSREVDDHVSRSFYDAGTSFPPVPDYLPGNPFIATFIVIMSQRW